jgi:hypothetical protein
VTDLAAHGIEVSLPPGWEGRVFRRPVAGEAASADANIEGEPAAPMETTNAVLHASTIPLPPGVGDFASGAVDKLRHDDVLIVLFEYDPASADQPLFQASGLPRQLTPDDFSPNVMQRAIRGQAGAQKFFNDQGRAFCLYVVLGAFARRADLVPRVNQVLASLTIDPLDASASTAPTSSTAPAAPTSSATTSSTEPGPTTTAPASTTAAPTTSGATP